MVATAALVVFLSVPVQVLAAPADLLVSPSPTTIVQNLNNFASGAFTPVQTPIPAHNYTSASAVAATASPVTETGIRTVVVAVAAVKPKVKPGLDAPVILEGEASYYSRAGCLGCDPNMIMANGQSLDDGALTMAIGADKKHLVGYQAKVTSLTTGKSVVVRITDTGGFYQAKYGHRVADLTIATKTAIGMKGGLGQVRVEVF